jgi:hypothetical protein
VHLFGTTISCRLSPGNPAPSGRRTVCWRRFWDLDQLPSASEQLPAAPAIVREELYDADLGSFGPFSLWTATPDTRRRNGPLKKDVARVQMLP